MNFKIVVVLKFQSRARAGAAEGKGAPRPGRGRPSPRLPGALRPGKTQHAGATESALLWRTWKLEPHSAQGPLHIEQPGAWAGQTGKHRHPCAGQTQCGRNTASAPHTQRCLPAAPTLPAAGLNWTQIRDHLRPPVSGRKLDTEETANRSQINKGNHNRKDRCNGLKSLKVTPTKPEGAYRYCEV